MAIASLAASQLHEGREVENTPTPTPVAFVRVDGKMQVKCPGCAALFGPALQGCPTCGRAVPQPRSPA